MSRWGMVIDLAACTGCGACTVVCRQENNVPTADAATFFHGRNQDWIQLATKVVGDYEDLHVQQTPLMCQQCEHPPCTKVCPVAATYMGANGIVGQIYNRCIGCRYCTNACPYSVKTFNWFTPKFPDGTDRAHNPDVSIRPRGVVEKCTFCHHRLQKGSDQARFEGRELRAGGRSDSDGVRPDYLPACVEVCPAGAIVFGDLEDSTSEVRRAASGPRASKLLEDLGTEPKVTYLRPFGGDQ